MSRSHFVFLAACGCPTGVIDRSAASTQMRAWMEMYGTARKAEAAQERGTTLVAVTHDEYTAHYFQAMLDGCPHAAAVLP